MSVTVSCIECGQSVEVTPSRAKIYKFCGFDCRSAWRAKHWRGENNPRYTGGERTKTCQHCGSQFSHRRGRPITTFRKQKFCSKPCADKGGKRYFGPENSKWTGQPTRRQQRPSKHAAWAKAVISRDHATCRHCGAQGTELHAHHIKSHKDHPELRFDVDNGLTLCAPCHWQVHSKTTENGVNSGKPAAGQAGGNPDPSFGRKPVEGATTRGRAYRRWEGSCGWCGSFLSRRWSDAVGKTHLFCSRSCAGKFKRALPKLEPVTIICAECKTPTQVPPWRPNAKFCGKSCATSHRNRQRYANGSNASTSAPHPPSRVVI